MNAFLRRFIGAIGTGLVLAVALPASSAALQLGGTIDFDTGPVAWDQADGRDPILNGVLGAGYRMPRMLGLRPELLGEFALSSRPVEQAAVRWDIGARLHTSGTRGGVWLGAAVGAAGTWNRRSELTRIEGGIRRAVGPARINLWLSRTGFGVGIAPHGGLGQDSAASPDTLMRNGVTEYTELGSLATLRLSRYELGLSLARRLGGAAVRRTGWEVSATWWVAPSVGVVGATGHSLPQFGFTVPGARYGTLGLRLALGARSPTEQARGSVAAAKAIGGPTLLVADRLLTIRSAPARRAEVMGDFTDWKAQPLIPRGGGRWIHPAALSPGVHHLNVRFDGGAWLVPSGAVAMDDGFGGRVGLVVVR
jgi:hypothetical protein